MRFIISILLIGSFIQLYSQNIIEVDGIYYRLYRYGTKDEVFEATLIAKPDGTPYDIENVVIPDFVKYNEDFYEVHSIDRDSFLGNKSVKTVKLNNRIHVYYYNLFKNSTIESIEFPEDNVALYIIFFEGCKNIETVTFNSKNTEIFGGDGKLPSNIKKVVFLGDSNINSSNLAETAPPKRLTTESENDENEANHDEITDLEIDWGLGRHEIKTLGLQWFTGKRLYITGNTRLYGFYPSYSDLPYLGWNNVETIEFEQRIPWDNEERYTLSSCCFDISSTLKKVICHDPEPWEVDIFNDNTAQVLKDVTLYVPSQSVVKYKSHPAWGQYGTILPIEDGIDDVVADADNNEWPLEYYNLQGVRVDNPAKGSVVIRKQGSKTEKIIVR